MKPQAFALIPILAIIIGISIIQLKPKGPDSPPSVATPQQSSQQYIVLLDLSDRLTQPGQIEADKALILKTFEAFEKAAKSALLMKSKERFQICIAPQAGLPFDKERMSETLSFDLAEIQIADRLKRLQAFKQELPKLLDELYEQAYRGSDKKAYAGSNIWQFFNETLPVIYQTQSTNKLLVLTDGYFDFEPSSFAKLQKGNLSTTTNDFIGLVRSKADWKGFMQAQGYGILPVQHNFDQLTVFVGPIRSKQDMNLQETEMLTYIWEQWLMASGIPAAQVLAVPHTSTSLMSKKLAGHF